MKKVLALFLALFLGLFLVGTTNLDPGRFPIEVEDVADGTADHALGWDGSGVAVSQSRDGVRAFDSAAQSIPNNAWTTIDLNSERYDDNTMHDTVTNNSRLTATVEGRYLIIANIGFAADATKNRGVRILVNGTTVIAWAQAVDRDTNGLLMGTSVIENLAATDYVEMQGYQNTGGALNTFVAGNSVPEFMMQRLRSQ